MYDNSVFGMQYDNTEGSTVKEKQVYEMVEDIKKMSVCRDFIISASTYGWWCAYLSLPGQICSFILIETGYHGRQLQGNRRFHKWFFYLWYPLHLLMLWVCAIVSTLA